jgi:hypothetical protein
MGGIVQLIRTPVTQEAAGSSPVPPANVPPMSPFDREERSPIAGYCEFRFARHRDTTAERLSISLRKTGKRLHAICKPGLWPSEVQSLPTPSCIT